MQKIIFLPVLLVLLMGHFMDASASTSVIKDTIIKSQITLQQFPITNLTGITDLSVKKKDPKLYYGKWQWTNNEQDTFTVTIQPNRGQSVKNGKKSKSDVLCYYNIIKKGKLVYNSMGNEGNNPEQSFSCGYASEKALLIAPEEARMLNLDEYNFFVFQLVSDNNDVANLNKGSLLPFFEAAFNKQVYPSARTFPVDLIMKKISDSY
ncbi:MAG: hypothetical protein ACN4EP_02850 [Sediminibacterium sp.]|jgi:hypothetical protein